MRNKSFKKKNPLENEEQNKTLRLSLRVWREISIGEN